jgi:hypothetical protein
MVLGSDNKIQQSTDRGATWRQLANIVPIPPKPDGIDVDAWEDPGATVLQISVLDPLRAVMLTPPVSRPNNRLWKKVTVEGDWQNVRWESRMDQP